MISEPSAPRHPLLPRPLARALDEHATCCRCIQWEELLGCSGGEEGVGSPRGLGVASCSGHYIPQKRAVVLGEAKVEQRTRQKTKQGPPGGGPGGGMWALPRGSGPGRTDRRAPLSPLDSGGIGAHTTLLWVSFQHDTERCGLWPM